MNGSETERGDNKEEEEEEKKEEVVGPKRQQQQQLSNDLFIQTSDDSQCIGWSNSQLTYLGKDCFEIPKVLIKLYASSAKRADFSFCSLQSLKGLESFACLEELILDNNHLTDDTTFPSFFTLRILSINKNRLKHLNGLLDKLSNSYPRLTFLSLLGNDVCPDQLSTRETDQQDYQRYRYSVIFRLPKLMFLDSRKVKPSERKEAARIGHFIGNNLVIRPSFQTSSRNTEENDLQEGTSLIDNLLTGRRQSTSNEENGLARRGGGVSDGNRGRTSFDGGTRRASASSSIRRESGTLFHPLSNLIPVPSSDLITTSALPRNDSSSNIQLVTEGESGEESPPVQARTRHDILLAEGVETKDHENVESGEKLLSEDSSSFSSSSSPSVLSSSESSAIQGYGRNPFSTLLSSNSSEHSKRSFDSLSSFIVPPSWKSTSTSNSQKAIRDALTSGSGSLADFSSFLASRSSFEPTRNMEFLMSTSDNDQQQSPQQKEQDFVEQQKPDPGDRVQEDLTKVTGNSGVSDGTSSGSYEEQVKIEEKPISVNQSPTSSQEGTGGGVAVGGGEDFSTQQMVQYQSPRPPNVRAPQVYTSPLHRHWANKHAWFATRRPLLMRPFFPQRPRFPPPLPPSKTQGGGKYPSSHRTQKYMRPVDYVRNRYYPKRRNMYPPSQFQRRPSLFSSLFQPTPMPSSTSSFFMANHPNQMQTNPASQLLMMYPMNLRNWFLNNPLFAGTRRPAQQSMNINPSLLAFPFPTITNRLPPPPSKFNAIQNQDPRKSLGRRNNYRGRERGVGGIKTAASTTSSTYTIAKESGDEWNSASSRTSSHRRQSNWNDGSKRNGNVKYNRGKKKRRANRKGTKVSRSVSETGLNTNDGDRKEGEKGRKRAHGRSSIPINTWRGINGEKLTKQHHLKESRREEVSQRIGGVRNVAGEQIDDTNIVHHVRKVRSYLSGEEFPGMRKVHFNDSFSSKKSPIIVPVSSYLSFVASASDKESKNNTSRPHLSHHNPPRPIQMRTPDIPLTAEPTFQLFDGSHVMDKHDIHHHYYYNDRSDSEPEEDEYSKNKKEEKKVDQKKEVGEKKSKEKVIEEMEKKKKQKMKEKKFMDEEGKKKKKVEEKKEMNEDDLKTKDTGQKDDNYKSNEEGKLGVYWFKDSGHKKHGWKNVYHKEEWGDSKKFHDIFHDKDWKKKWNKWDSSKEKSKGSKYKSDKERYTAKKLADEKKYEKGGHKKWQREHGSGYEKKEHLDSHQEKESSQKKSNAQRLKGKQSKNDRSVIRKQPKVPQKHPSASTNVHEHHHDPHGSHEQDHHMESDHHHYSEDGTESPITDSNDFRQTPQPRKRHKNITKTSPQRGEKKVEMKGKKPLTDVTSRRVKHYPDERIPLKHKMQKVREQDPRESESEAIRPHNVVVAKKKPRTYFNRKKPKKEIHEEVHDEDEEAGSDEAEEQDEAGQEDVEDWNEENDGEKENEGGTNNKKRNKDRELSNNELVSGKHDQNNRPSKEQTPVYYYSPNKFVPMVPFNQVYGTSSIRGGGTGGSHGIPIVTKIHANTIRDYKSENVAGNGSYGKVKQYSVPSSTGHQSTKQLLVSPPSPSSSAPFMYPSMPVTPTTTIYGPTVPIIEQTPNTYQALPTTSSYFIPNNNLIHRRPGLAFLSVLRSLTAAPPSMLLPSSSTPSFSPSSLIPSASTPKLTKLLYQPVASGSSPTPTHVSSFSYHLEQLQKQKQMGKPAR